MKKISDTVKSFPISKKYDLYYTKNVITFISKMFNVSRHTLITAMSLENN